MREIFVVRLDNSYWGDCYISEVIEEGFGISFEVSEDLEEAYEFVNYESAKFFVDYIIDSIEYSKKTFVSINKYFTN